MKVDEPQVSQRHEDLETNGKTTTLLFSLKELEILHQERREQVNFILIEHFKSTLFHKPRLACKQHTYQSVNGTFMALFLIESSASENLVDGVFSL